MNNNIEAITNDVATLADDARAFMHATADVAGEKVTEARQRLHAALERSKVMYGRVREKAVEGAKVTNKAVHEHPYQAIAIGVAVGAVIGFIVAQRNCSTRY